jgi:hypothetical protein
MIPIINLYNLLERELEFERQGLRRTRRWIGDDNRVTDDKWFQQGTGPISRHTRLSFVENQPPKTGDHAEKHTSIFSRLLHLPRIRRNQPAVNKCQSSATQFSCD